MRPQDQTPTPQNPQTPNVPPQAQAQPVVVADLTQPVPLTPSPNPAQNQTATPPAQAAPAPAAPNQDAAISEEPKKPSFVRKFIGFIASWIIVPGILVLFVHNFVFQAWYVDGQSMEPTFQNGDYLIVSKFESSYKRLTGQANNINITRGEVVIFNPPGYNTDIYFIKRAIGLPGDRVYINDGVVTIYNESYPNGLVLNEKYTGSVKLQAGPYNNVTVPPGEIFFIGDNRNPEASQDSRFIGPVPKDHIIGTASLRLLPVSQFGTVNQPSYK